MPSMFNFPEKYLLELVCANHHQITVIYSIVVKVHKIVFNNNFYIYIYI